MTRLLPIFLLALAGLASASVTAAWKLPIGSRIPDHETDPKVVKLAKPPGESAFFEAGDGLWDVSKALRWEIWNSKTKESEDPFEVPELELKPVPWQGEWVVWNARSGMFVARGSWQDIQFVEQVLGVHEQLTIMRSRIEVVEGHPGDVSEPPEKPRSLSITARSGNKAKAVLDGFEVDIEISASPSEGICDVRCGLSWPAGVKDRRWHVTTGISVGEDVRTRLARHGEGPGSWEVYLTVSRDLPDGTPVAELRWVETAKGLESWKLLGSGRKDNRKSLGPNRELTIYPVPENVLLLITGHDVAPSLPDVEAPAELAEWVRGPLIDFEKPLRENGVEIDIPGGHFAGFDPRRREVFIVSDSTVHDLVRQILGYGSSAPGQLWIETNAESGGWGLTCRSGEKAAIGQVAGEVNQPVFEIEPTLGADGEVIDLRYKFDVVAGEQLMGRIESVTTLINGNPAQVATHSKEGMEDVEVVVTGTVTGGR